MITKDVPKLYDINKQLLPDSWIEDQKKINTAAMNSKPAINLPISGSKGMWNWLQPYRVDKKISEKKIGDDKTLATTPAGEVSTPPQLVTRFNALEVGKEDGKMRMDPGPYTFVEGFLQLARPLVAPKANTSTL